MFLPLLLATFIASPAIAKQTIMLNFDDNRAFEFTFNEKKPRDISQVLISYKTKPTGEYYFKSKPDGFYRTAMNTYVYYATKTIKWGVWSEHCNIWTRNGLCNVRFAVSIDKDLIGQTGSIPATRFWYSYCVSARGDGDPCLTHSTSTPTMHSFKSFIHE